ncbi:MAG TPA: hypothetical protein VI792_08805, partial [Candidatus Eisenbacteria bacterium]
RGAPALAAATGGNPAGPAAGTHAGFQPFAQLGVLGGQYRYWFFSDGTDLRNPIIYWAPGWFHVQLEYWDFLKTDSNDHARPEIGLHLRDYRRSVYTLQWQHQLHQERWWIATEQVLSHGFVGRVSFSAITTNDAAVDSANGGSPVWVNEIGADYYFGSYNFASLTVVRDPRQGGLWIVPMRVRLANEKNDWVQATYSPASERTAGWALDGKLAWFRAGIERNSRYDFTNVDNLIVTVGFEVSLDRPR